MEKIIGLTDILKTGLRQMFEEHKAIVAALSTLSEIAKKENKKEYLNFAKKLICSTPGPRKKCYIRLPF